MAQEELGFAPTIRRKVNHEKPIEVERNVSKQRVIIGKVMLQARCIAGRATTCWRAHPEGRLETLGVIKDLWQYPEREEEGEMFSKVTEKGVTHVARYYHHETVQVHGMDDDIRNSIRQGLDVPTASDYRLGRLQQSRIVMSEEPR